MADELDIEITREFAVEKEYWAILEKPKKQKDANKTVVYAFKDNGLTCVPFYRDRISAKNESKRLTSKHKTKRFTPIPLPSKNQQFVLLDQTKRKGITHVSLHDETDGEFPAFEVNEITDFLETVKRIPKPGYMGGSVYRN